MNQLSKYTGGCHGGAVRYAVEADLSQPMHACNRSMCGRSGILLAFVPIEKFTLEQGSEFSTGYQSPRRVIHHLFCKVCGLESFARAGAAPAARGCPRSTCAASTAAIRKLEVKHIDGRSR